MVKKIFLSVSVVTVLIGLVVSWQFYHALHQVNPLPQEHRQITVPAGASFRTIIREGERNGVFPNGLTLLIYSRFTGVGAQIKAGEYALPEQASALQILEILKEGKSIQYDITLIEGQTFHEWLQTIWAHEKITKELQGLSQSEMMQKISGRDEYPEGRFYPDTYRFTQGYSDLDLLKRSYQTMQAVLQEEWSNRSEGLPYQTPYEALIMASIIEKETGLASERPAIAGVFVRRLEKRMRLQTDPTVIYGLGQEFDGNLTRKHLKQDTPYNSYTRHGLPPTPISMVSREAVHAALHPEEGTALYFVARGDGSHEFSSNLKDHNRAVRKYQWKRREDYRSRPTNQ